MPFRFPMLRTSGKESALPHKKSAHQKAAQILDLLAESGMRRTAARQCILEMLFSAQGHVTAEGLAAEVQKTHPSVDVSTVYRTLGLLEELGLVDHVHLAHGPAIFHLAEDNHQHLVCDRCGRVEEVPPSDLQPLAAMLKGRFDFELAPRHFAIVGICGSCVAAAARESAGAGQLAPARTRLV
jgi:Fur family ferric uptake transcriptional regulator